MGWPCAVAFALALLVGCSDDIGLPTPKDLAVKQIGFGQRGTVELSWRLVVRVDRYLLHYDDDKKGLPYEGKGLGLVAWNEGCGDFDAGTIKTFAAEASVPDSAPDVTLIDAGAKDSALVDSALVDGSSDASAVDLGVADAKSPSDAPVADSIAPGRSADSPVEIPATWCLDTRQSFTDAGAVPVQTPGQTPRVRLQNLTPGRTYHFAVQVGRRAATGAITDSVAITIAKTAPKP